MQLRYFSPTNRRGITVLALLLIIIALVLVAFFLVSYLRTRPVQVQSRSGESSLPLSHQSLDQLNLAGVIQVVRSNSVDLLGIGPHAAG
jgi:hypothetical protein